MTVRYVGVRHHSPACSRLVRHAIRTAAPAYVLIEGPADMNERLAELALGHSLPIAIFTYFHGDERSHSSWSPFCEYSPEWVAIREGLAVGAEVRFIDLPAWHDAFSGVRNRYSDGARRTSLAIRRLCDRAGLDGMDSLWDHLFEQPMDEAVLETRLAAYFEGLRGDEPGGERDGPREDYMARCVAWAAKRADGAKKDVVVVTGGFHKPALERLVPALDGAEWPVLPSGGAGRHGSFLVPYSFKRLDAFVGYESGMPSPAYYQAVWDHGAADASEQMLRAAVGRLRERGQRVSAADLIAARVMSEGLARLRGHTVLARTDLLDGLAAALVKDAHDVPLPWTTRGPLRHGTDPTLVEVVVALSGELRGTLHPDTPRPPLLQAARGDLEVLELWPTTAPQDLAVDLTAAAGLAKSRALHRVRVLGIPGYTRVSGPAWATDGVLEERWKIVETFEQESAWIEAGAHGATLETAAAAVLEERLLGAGGDLDALTAILGDATFVGIDTLSTRILAAVAAQVGLEADFKRLGRALSRLVALHRHDTLLGSARSAAIGAVIRAAYDRGLWLVEGITGGPAPADDGLLDAVVAIRDAIRHTGSVLGLDPVVAHEVMARRASDKEAPPALRGAALGLGWSLGRFASAAEAEEHAVTAVRRAARPTELGDFLAGLFALAREEVLAIEERSAKAEGDGERPLTLLTALDAAIVGQTLDDYLIALPSLRLAFSFFPPVERERIAQRVLALHGRSPAAARQMVRMQVQPGVVAEGLALEARVDAIEALHGLGPEGAPA